eukprot:gnl/TRDRNA2_/TRDRNA2_185944_c0_seq1.p2 gnl/TRDRNA2_/TRDRNA2_185944_c0~~gnl/TRDRNA2_/TRDRNA2_185944_c0_seq1.p2  ORF type:complete len:221 (-),score=36.47 gnl/TRDRNA2_/TRDRNA2_185944_c0_seq1:269-931(-)
MRTFAAISLLAVVAQAQKTPTLQQRSVRYPLVPRSHVSGAMGSASIAPVAKVSPLRARGDVDEYGVSLTVPKEYLYSERTFPPGQFPIHKIGNDECMERVVNAAAAVAFKIALWQDGTCKNAGYKRFMAKKDDVAYFTLQSARYEYWVKTKWAKNKPKNPLQQFLGGFGKPSELAQNPSWPISLPAVVLMGFFAGSGITFAAFHCRRRALTLGDEPLCLA